MLPKLQYARYNAHLHMSVSILYPSITTCKGWTPHQDSPRFGETKTWHFFRFLAACCAPPPKIEKNAIRKSWRILMTMRKSWRILAKTKVRNDNVILIGNVIIIEHCDFATSNNCALRFRISDGRTNGKSLDSNWPFGLVSTSKI